MRPRIDVINDEIARMRSSKGQNPKANGEDVKLYCGMVNELAAFSIQVRNSSSSLIQLKEEEKTKSVKERKTNTKLLVIVPIITMLLGLILGNVATRMFV